MPLNFRNHVFVFCTAAALAALAAGCDDKVDSTAGPQSPQAAAQPAADALPPGLALAEAPAGAEDIVELKKHAKEGDAVVLRGRVGGSASPFVEGRASVQLVDRSLKACGEGNPDDKCETPWDFCCEVPKEIAAHAASVQVVGADGKPLRAGLQGLGGLKPLSEVTVKGTVAKAAESGALVVNATGLHVKNQ